ncbi:hypothetical protein B0H13DRAFT_754361 [Mycena leptocephala]|nr:hypothetical protein B0H13DRAFT_754361 [Mycena leptocephala]
MQLVIPFSSLRDFSSSPFNIRGTNPDVEGATTAHGRGSVREECAEDRRGSAGEKEPAGQSTREVEEECARSYTLEGGDERSIEEAAHADTTHHGDAQTDKDDASLLAAALAEIELLEAASRSVSLHPDHATQQAADVYSDADADAVAVLTPETDEAAPVDDDEDATLHNDEEEPTPILIPYPHIFAIGDAADAFGALPAGHNAWAQG